MKVNFLKKILLGSVSVISVMLLSACSWVQPLPEADKVAVMQFEDVSKCQKLGSTRNQTLDKITIFERSEDAKYQELVALAKNEAVRMRGDTIVPLTTMQDGIMEFAIYNCF